MPLVQYGNLNLAGAVGAGSPPRSPFFRRGVSKILWLPAVADPGLVPTALEVAAGTDLSPYLATVSGLMFTNAPIKTPVLGVAFTSEIIGEDVVSATKFSFNDDDTDTVVRTTLAKNIKGFLYLCPYGKVSGKRAETWPATSAGVNDAYTTSNGPAMTDVEFAVTGRPNQSVVQP